MGKKIFLLAFVFVLLVITILRSGVVSAADTGIVVNNSKVTINTTYTEGVFRLPGYPKITSRLDNSSLLSSTTPPPPSGFISCGTGNINFLTITDLLPGNYTYTIIVQDCVGNSRYDSKNFTVFFKWVGCGDGVVNASTEECDDGNRVNGDGCSSACLKESCNNSRIDSGEECDGLNLGGKICDDFDNFQGGTLTCSNKCTFNTSQCHQPLNTCGNGIIDSGEQCDGANWGPITNCTSFSSSFTGGVLTCNSNNSNKCLFNTSRCFGTSGGYCGDNVISIGEQCDGSVPKSCSDFDNFVTGNLKCNNCTYNTSDCSKPNPRCGDYEINVNETCDGLSWGKITDCANLSFVGGILKCNGPSAPSGFSCHFNTSGCWNNNGTVNLSCTNNIRDGLETDVDCGGSCLCCAKQKKCSVNNDCCSGFCQSNICAEPSCDDFIKNGDEADVDCGGSCPACKEGKNCTDSVDCIQGLFCDAANLCAKPTCDDGVMNGRETDVDCGGANCTVCKDGLSCQSNTDCKTNLCESGVCSCDRTKDTDNDGMPDCWEQKYDLDPSNPADAKEDLDGDGSSNLDEFKNGTDPSDPNDPPQKKSHTLSIIFLIIGLLLMIGSASFLVYSRKVLIPEERAKQAQQGSSASAQPVAGARPGQSRIMSGGGQGKPRVGGKSSLAEALAKRRQARVGAPGAAKTDSASAKSESAKLDTAAAKPSAGSSKEGSDFISISELGKKNQSKDDDKSESNGSTQSKSPISEAFNRLKSLTQVKKDGSEAKDTTSALKDLASKKNDKPETKEPEAKESKDKEPKDKK